MDHHARVLAVGWSIFGILRSRLLILGSSFSTFPLLRTFIRKSFSFFFVYHSGTNFTHQLRDAWAATHAYWTPYLPCFTARQQFLLVILRRRDCASSVAAIMDPVGGVDSELIRLLDD